MKVALVSGKQLLNLSFSFFYYAHFSFIHVGLKRKRASPGPTGVEECHQNPASMYLLGHTDAVIRHDLEGLDRCAHWASLRPTFLLTSDADDRQTKLRLMSEPEVLHLMLYMSTYLLIVKHFLCC